MGGPVLDRFETEMKLFTIILGDPIKRFVVVGTFATAEDARNHAKTFFKSSPWLVVQIRQPFMALTTKYRGVQVSCDTQQEMKQLQKIIEEKKLRR